MKRSRTAHNLGVIMDSSMHMDNHIAYWKKRLLILPSMATGLCLHITRQASKMRNACTFSRNKLLRLLLLPSHKLAKEAYQLLPKHH